MHIVFANEIFENNGSLDTDDDPEMEETLAAIRGRELAKTTVWTHSEENCNNYKKTFSEETGPSIPVHLESPHDIFLHLFPSKMIEEIAFQTNLYAIQKNGGDPKTFNPTNAKEIQVFIGINILMGVKNLPSYCEYWSSRPELRDYFIISAMTRDRFAWLLGNIHLADNSVMPRRGSPDFDKLQSSINFEYADNTFTESYKPSKDQSIDESMIRFKGRSTLKQFMPLKPIKRGYKVWIRADESGYACQFQIYSGKVESSTEKDLGARSEITEGDFPKIQNRKKELPERGVFDWPVSKDGLTMRLLQQCCRTSQDKMELCYL
ncbi:hypothetical protein NQ318_016422 [Aromia moschata]|uniref:PiggyBac transposable element-derived protein domain-containing protein n=1 Tax=Aromia moschata TaxID=1265417 RepID=A0AAV8Z461_9CUCU|nr:hypothetical protein NQ318_016422 [Aromia moschata]